MKRIGKKGGGEFERVSWDEAYRMIAENLLRVKKEYGPQATAFYAGYPKWYRPALLRLSNAYGSPNYCTESSTCDEYYKLKYFFALQDFVTPFVCCIC